MSWKDDLNYGLAAFGIRIPDKVPVDQWAQQLTGQPARNTATLVGVSSVLFYMAERDYNPKVNDIWDALEYCSTCISVGYADIFPRTPIGKIIGSALMTVGPAMAARALDGSTAATATSDSGRVQEEILSTLRQILARIAATPNGSDPG